MQIGKRLLEFVLEDISDADQFYVRVSRQQIDCRPGAASAAAYQPGPQAHFSRPSHKFRLDDGKAGCCRAGSYRFLEEGPASATSKFIRRHESPPAAEVKVGWPSGRAESRDRKSTRLNSSHLVISYAV